MPKSTCCRVQVHHIAQQYICLQATDTQESRLEPFTNNFQAHGSTQECRRMATQVEPRYQFIENVLCTQSHRSNEVGACGLDMLTFDTRQEAATRDNMLFSSLYESDYLPTIAILLWTRVVKRSPQACSIAILHSIGRIVFVRL